MYLSHSSFCCTLLLICTSNLQGAYHSFLNAIPRLCNKLPEVPLSWTHLRFVHPASLYLLHSNFLTKLKTYLFCQPKPPKKISTLPGHTCLCNYFLLVSTFFQFVVLIFTAAVDSRCDVNFSRHFFTWHKWAVHLMLFFRGEHLLWKPITDHLNYVFLGLTHNTVLLQ